LVEDEFGNVMAERVRIVFRAFHEFYTRRFVPTWSTRSVISNSTLLRIARTRQWSFLCWRKCE